MQSFLHLCIIASFSDIFTKHVTSFSITSIRSTINSSNIPNTSSTTTRLHAIEVPTLDDLDNSHEKEGSRLAQSIIGWLDQEWMPQEVHVQMATCVKDSFVKARNDGETEVS